MQSAFVIRQDSFALSAIEARHKGCKDKANVPNIEN